jgi:hypothetical protein
MSLRPVPLQTRTDRLLAIVLQGAWHCASWVFAVWSLFQGVGLGAHAPRILSVLARRPRIEEVRPRLTDSIRIHLPVRGLGPFRLVMPPRIVTSAFLVTAWIILLFLFSPAERSALVYFRF